MSISRGSGTLKPLPVLTRQQQQAVAAVGNVLVMAGAGTGKTRTLVERCLQRLLDPDHPIGLDQILVVTFTEAAAAETRLRIRRRLEEAAAAHPADRRLAEAIALADTAHIGTLHGFCLALVREHFHELGLDPQLTVLDPAQAALLAARTLDELLRRHYAGTAPLDRAVRELVATHGQGRDEVLRASVLRLHEYAQTLPDPAAWLRAQREAGEQTTPEQMWEELRAAFLDWRAEWLERLAELAPVNSKAAAARDRLAEGPAVPDRAQVAAVLEHVLALDRDWPRGTKTKLRPPLAELFEDAQFLADLAVVQAGTDPLVEDWSWVRPHRQALLDLADEFGRAYADAKRELAALDFHDLEQFALDLLRGRDRAGLTDLARQWRERFAHVFVDEYQDINAAQDAILRALSREGVAANRFLVGDVKQSIYRFRLADPRIFQNYARAWRGGPEGVCLPLNENFRSRPALLEFVNALFAPLMRREVGGVDYDADAHLRPGRADHSPPAPAGPPVELLLHLTGNDADQPEGVEESAATGDDDRQATEREAALVAARLRALQAAGLPVWDEAAAAWRPVRWSDMVVLLRAPRLRAEVYAREFARAGVPLLARRAGLYETPEVRDLLCLLQLLDNPLQDLPLLAVLRSPLVGLDVNELAVIRLAAPRERFWTALVRFGEAHTPASPPAPGETAPAASARASARPKVDRFLEQFARWRDAARLLPLSQCLELVLEETRYEDGLRLLPRGEARVANVRRLLVITREFDRLQRQGLLRFLQFLEAQLEAEFDPEPAPLDHADAVRLMSIHQSKGLEFPVVVVADLGKQFNTREHTAALVLEEQSGPALRVRPPGRHASYPSLPYWRAERRGRRETLGEELRLLYVALTRARDHLLLTGTVSAEKAKKRLPVPRPRCSLAVLLDARCPLDWIGPLMPRLSGDPNWLEQAQGSGALLTWRVVRASETIALAAPEPAAPAVPEQEPARLAELAARLAWQYPHPAATRQPAKASVSALRRRAVEAADEESVRWFAEPVTRRSPGEAAPGGAGLSAVERGAAHHRFLQFADWTALADAAGVRAEAERLVVAGRLTRAEVACLDAAALAALGASELGRAVRADAAWVRRELEFTARLRPADFTALGLPCESGLGPEEFVVVQGVVDLAVVAPERIWLADFKTDAVTTPEELAARAASYAPQLRLYALALGRVYTRPVTAAWLHFLTLNRTVPVALVAG